MSPLGAAESGKSTVFKQMIIFGNVVDAAQVLLRHLAEIPQELQSAHDLLDKLQVDELTESIETVTDEAWDAITNVWHHAEVQKLYLERAQIQIKEATA